MAKITLLVVLLVSVLPAIARKGKYTFMLKRHCRLGPNFIELLKQGLLLINFLLSKIERDTDQKLYIRHGNLAGNLILVGKL